jgi:PAS domain S-box-containing protein
MKHAEVESPTVLPGDSFVPLESILCTEELNRRPSRAPNYEAENCALVGLAQALADSPRTILQTMAEKMLEVFQCDSAGFSLLTKDEKSFYWPAIAGMWQPHIGGGTPRDFGPCGDVLDCNGPMLFTHWERRYPYLLAAMPLAQEGLLVPFYIEGKAVGTIWAIAHDDRRKFDAEDMRQLVSLGSFASSAYQVVASLDALEQRDEALRQSCEELEERVVERTSQLTAVNEELRHQILERDRAEAALRTSEGKYRDLINTSPDAIYVLDEDGKCVLSNAAGAKLAGCPEDKLIGSLIADMYMPEERDLVQQRLDKLKAEGALRFEREFLRGNGHVVPVEVSYSALRGRHYQAIIRDISRRKRREALLAGENRLLEMVAKGDSLANILCCLCVLVEEQSSDVLASILLLDANGKRLRHGGAPNLPKAYTNAIDGAFIGPSMGSCGTAAYPAEQVIVSDIATDPLWADFRDLALAHSLRTCWSTPIFSSEGKVIGTFAMYYREPRSPTSSEQVTIKHVTHLAGVAIQRKLAETARRESEAYLAEAQRLSHTGSWAWAPATGEIRYWSEETYRVLGFDADAGPPRFETFFQRLCLEDQVRVKELFENAVREKADFETEYRIVHPGGAIRNIRAVGHPVCDEAGQLVEFVGTVIDVTESKRAEQALRASEQVARGQVEALVQSLDVLATAPEPDKFIGQMLSTIGRLLDAQSVGLWLFDEPSDSFVCRFQAEGEKPAAPDPDHPLMKDPSSWKRDPIIQELLFTAGPVVCEDVETDPRVSRERRNYLKRGGTKRFLAVPILIGGQSRGVIKIRHADRPPYRPEEIELTQALAHQVMLAIQLNEFAEQGQRAAVLEERNRMARDIHDTLAQGFTGVLVQLQAAEDAISRGWRKQADEHLQRVSELARQSLSEARRSVHALRPQALQEQNFWDALKGIIKNTTVGTALHTKFEARGKLPELPQPWQENLLHIGQEALTNSLKYAHACNFKTRLSYKARELRLELRDDGDGFKIKDRHDGMGLTGMRERVEQMGGELKIASLSGKGTKITVVLPCDESMS